jgi:hypothetical protein
MASTATAVGDQMIAQASTDPVSTIQAKPESKSSVFDDPAVIEVDSLVDSLAEDTASANDADSATKNLDRLFAEL